MWQDIAYDADKNITSLIVATPDKLLAQNTYSYDGNGQRIEKEELAGKTLYTYDSLNRLEQAEYPTYTERFTYDNAGNRLTRTAKDIEEQYIYDVNNRLTKRTVNGQEESYLYDKAGNLLQDANNAYEYDAFRRTSKVTTKAGITQINRYDAEGLRHEMEENGKLVQFIFNENKEVITEETDGNITRLIRTSDLWAMESEPEKTWYHYASDEQGSTVFITDAGGNVKNRYTYDAFGNTIESEEQIPNRYQYTGQQFDQITQQYYLWARFYNPAIARFTQEDEYHGDGLNLYAYCANNPVDYYDPSGYACKNNKNPVQHRTYKVNGIELNANQFARLRQRAVEEAWKEERRLAENGKGTVKWTPEEYDELLKRGRVTGYEGHHMKSASAHPDYAGDKKNIQFLKGRGFEKNEHLAAHNGNYRNTTNGYYNPETGETIDFGNNEPWKEIFDLK